MRVLFVEPPKNVWFIMGDYVTPPLGILTLASYLKTHNKGIEIQVLDCQAEKIGWSSLENRIDSFNPHVLVSSGLGTCNAYVALRTVEVAKMRDPEVKTVVGGQHFSALVEETLNNYPYVDFIVRGEGEKTLNELINALKENKPLLNVKGLSFSHKENNIHTLDRPLISDLDSLPFPGYDFVEEHMKKYYFTLLAGKETSVAIVEGSRGCFHNCSYCSQWRFWRRNRRSKSPERLANEIEYIHREFDTNFFLLADDDFNLNKNANNLGDILIRKGISEDITWFCQTRCDDIVEHKDLLPKMRKSGNTWMLTGFDNPNLEIMKDFRREEINWSTAKTALNLLRKNDILSQGMFIIGERRDSHETIENVRKYADLLDPDIATFMILTPFPGTEIYKDANQNGWIEDNNWSHYDMIHAIMSTEYLTRKEVQEELYECYRRYFGKWKRRYQGLFSSNQIVRRTYQYLAREAIMTGLQSLF